MFVSEQSVKKYFKLFHQKVFYFSKLMKTLLQSYKQDRFNSIQIKKLGRSRGLLDLNGVRHQDPA